MIMTAANQYIINQEATGAYITSPGKSKLHASSKGYLTKTSAGKEHQWLYQILIKKNEWRHLDSDASKNFVIILDKRAISKLFVHHLPRLILSKKSDKLLFDEAHFCKTFGMDCIDKISDFYDPDLDDFWPNGGRYLIQYRLRDQHFSIKFGLLDSEFQPLTTGWDKINLHRCDHADIDDWLKYGKEVDADKFRIADAYNEKLDGTKDVCRFEFINRNQQIFADQDKVALRFADQSAKLRQDLLLGR
ncbi:MAG: hypothetical protein LBJ18_04075 [Rickettsiales bacterium]|jgi:hypothetical protein|nr:hypothetical protein [Rickettsiales bacterium]